MGRKAFVAGNSIDDDGTIWLFDWETGDVAYLPVVLMTVREDRFLLSEENIVQRLQEWARAGNSDAMWWLGWWHEGKNHPKSVWYYVAALRANPKKHAWARWRICCDARSAYMGSDVPKPDISFLANITEMQGDTISTDWQGAIHEAEIAVHGTYLKHQL